MKASNLDRDITITMIAMHYDDNHNYENSGGMILNTNAYNNNGPQLLYIYDYYSNHDQK